MQLLDAAAARQPRRIALQRPLLLLVRCLLLGAVVLALAAPRVERAAGRQRARPWLLVEPGLEGSLPAGADEPGPEGEPPETRWLAPGLPLLGAGPRGLGGGPRGPAPAPPGIPDLAAVPGGVWSLLREASAAAPSGAELRVVTRGRLAGLAGDRPTLPRPVRWLTVPDPGPNRWLARAARSSGAGGEGFVAVIGRSEPERTSFTREDVAGTAGGGGAAFGITIQGSALVLAGGDSVAADDSLPLPGPGRQVRLALLAAPGREPDARFVAAAARAAAAQSGVRLELLAGPQAAGASPLPRLAFWLADTPPPPSLLAVAEAGGTLVLDAGRPEERCTGTLTPVPGGPTVPLRRCAALPAGAAVASRPVPARWSSDQGRPLLRVERVGGGRVLRFAGRFHPAWSDLVLSEAFPAWLVTLLEGASGAPPRSAEVGASDRRTDGGQGAPARGGSAGPRSPRPQPSRAPETALWAALPLLLIGERWLAGRVRR